MAGVLGLGVRAWLRVVTGARLCAPTGGGGGGMGKGWRLGVGFFALLGMTGGLLGMTGGWDYRGAGITGGLFGLWHVIMVGSGYRGWQGVGVINFVGGGVGDGGVFGLGVWSWLRGVRAHGSAPLRGAGGGDGKGLAAWGGILRFAQNDRGLLGMTGGWDYRGAGITGGLFG